jgi:hypothetical protein
VALTAFLRTIPIVAKQVDEQARQIFVSQAKLENMKVLDEQQKRTGFKPSWTGVGDNPPGGPIDNAKQTIVFKYTYLQEMISEFLKELRAASPADSGRYKNSHSLYIDGRPAPDNTPVTIGQDVYIANPVVYARRLEVGKTESGRDFLISVPNHIYERVAKKLGARYANAARIAYGYVTMPEAYQIKGKLPSHYIAKGGALRKRRQIAGTEVRAPAIFFEPL